MRSCFCLVGLLGEYGWNGSGGDVNLGWFYYEEDLLEEDKVNSSFIFVVIL